jgi:hypothetical protein
MLKYASKYLKIPAPVIKIVIFHYGWLKKAEIPVTFQTSPGGLSLCFLIQMSTVIPFDLDNQKRSLCISQA